MTFTAIKQVFAEAEGKINPPVLRWNRHMDGIHMSCRDFEYAGLVLYAAPVDGGMFESWVAGNRERGVNERAGSLEGSMRLAELAAALIVEDWAMRVRSRVGPVDEKP